MLARMGVVRMGRDEASLLGERGPPPAVGGSSMKTVRMMMWCASALAAASGASAQQLIRVLRIDYYDAYAYAELVPILECDGFGCTPDFYTEYISNSIYETDVEDPLSSGQYDDEGNTSGGLKETEIVGQFGVLLNSPFVQAGVSKFVAEAYSSATATIGGDLYSGEFAASASMGVEIFLGGLPNDRFSYSLEGAGNGSLGTTGVGQDAGEIIAPGVATVGAYMLGVSAGSSYSYMCPQCGSPPPFATDERGQIVQSVGGFAAKTLSVERDDSMHRWLQPGAGVDRRAWAFLPQGDQRIVMGGTFDNIGIVPAGKVAAWDGESWSPLGQGFNGGVRALVEFNGGIVAAGGFTEADGAPADHVAFWSGSQWLPMGEGLNRVVRALAVWEGVLYAGGEFIATESQPFAFLAKWDAGRQEWVGVVEVDGPVYALLGWDPVSGVQGPNALVFGGDFDNVDGMPVRNIAAIERFGGDFYFYEPAGGVNGTVLSLTRSIIDNEYGDRARGFIAGGEFTRAGYSLNIITNRVAEFDLWDFVWRPMGSGVGGPVNSVYVHNPGDSQVVVVGGDFSTAGGQPALNIARFDSGAWSPMGDGLNNYVGAVSMFRGEVFATGQFSASGSLDAGRVARWTLDEPPPPVCQGDLNGDQEVGFADLNMLVSVFNTTGAPGFPGDIDGDGDCDFNDLNALISVFNTSCD